MRAVVREDEGKIKAHGPKMDPEFHAPLSDADEDELEDMTGGRASRTGGGGGGVDGTVPVIRGARRMLSIVIIDRSSVRRIWLRI